MGRTKQTSRSGDKRRSPRCSCCGLSMKSFARTPKGRESFRSISDTCPPCTRDNHQDDVEQRRLTKDPFGLFVPADRTRPCRKISLKADKDGGEVAELNEEEERGLGLPLYTGAHTSEKTLYACGFLEADRNEDPDADKKINNRAERIAMCMNVFQLDASNPVMGDVIFTGPEWTSLREWEFEKFVKAGQY